VATSRCRFLCWLIYLMMLKYDFKNIPKFLQINSITF
jgi:hypothetical protein